jgi:hypothetical protein
MLIVNIPEADPYTGSHIIFLLISLAKKIVFFRHSICTWKALCTRVSAKNISRCYLELSVLSLLLSDTYEDSPTERRNTQCRTTERRNCPKSNTAQRRNYTESNTTQRRKIERQSERQKFNYIPVGNIIWTLWWNSTTWIFFQVQGGPAPTHLFNERDSVIRFVVSGFFHQTTSVPKDMPKQFKIFRKGIRITPWIFYYILNDFQEKLIDEKRETNNLVTLSLLVVHNGICQI